jgi:hypothetical protein
MVHQAFRDRLLDICVPFGVSPKSVEVRNLVFLIGSQLKSENMPLGSISLPHPSNVMRLHLELLAALNRDPIDKENAERIALLMLDQDLYQFLLDSDGEPFRDSGDYSSEAQPFGLGGDFDLLFDIVMSISESNSSQF